MAATLAEGKRHGCLTEGKGNIWTAATSLTTLLTHFCDRVCSVVAICHEKIILIASNWHFSFLKTGYFGSNCQRVPLNLSSYLFPVFPRHCFVSRCALFRDVTVPCQQPRYGTYFLRLLVFTSVVPEWPFLVALSLSFLLFSPHFLFRSVYFQCQLYLSQLFIFTYS